jgi:L-fuculose-phosphate aldolase
MESQEAAQNILRLGKLLAERGLIAGSSGNISVRLDHERIMLTSSGCHKGHLDAGDLVVVNGEGALLEGDGKPSSELPMHLYVYQNRPEIGACVHAHPPYATAFAVAGVALDDAVLPEAMLVVGPVPLTRYAPPGTVALPESLAEYIDDYDAFLLRNHGMLTIGRSLDEAGDRMEIVEHYARVLYLARQLGSVTHLPADDIARLRQLRDGQRAI